MTGQVKGRHHQSFWELGLRIKTGVLSIDPALLKADEFLQTAQSFNYFNVNGEERSLTVEANCLAFTYCQVAVVYRKAEANKMMVSYTDGTQKHFDGLSLDATTTQALFDRVNSIEKIEVDIKL